MRIGIDISMLVYQGSGVATYTYNFVKNLLKYDKARYRTVSGKQNEYRLFYSSLRRPPDFYFIDEFKKLGAKVYDYRLPPRILKFLWNKNHLLPVEWLIGKVDVYHSSDYLRPPLLKGTKSITTLHDLTWKLFPQYHTQDVITAHENKLKKTIKFKDEIIVDSQNTKKDLFKCFPKIKKNQVSVIYPGVGDNFRKITNKSEIKKVLKKYKIKYPANYLLYVGAIEPRKNLITAIKVFNKLLQDKKYSDFKFLIVGRAGWKNEEVYRCINTLKLNDKIVSVGYVKDEDLVYFYNSAKVFIYLSLYEGFGLPPLEAAKCGVPTLLYSNSSLKEIFPKNYPFSKKGFELKTLSYLLENKNKIKLGFVKKYNWKNYCSNLISFWLVPRSLKSEVGSE